MVTQGKLVFKSNGQRVLPNFNPTLLTHFCNITRYNKLRVFLNNFVPQLGVVIKRYPSFTYNDLISKVVRGHKIT